MKGRRSYGARDGSPSRLITGAKTRLVNSNVIGTDRNGNIYASNWGDPLDEDNSITVYGASDNGNVSPTRRIAGPKTELSLGTGLIVDLPPS